MFSIWFGRILQYLQRFEDIFLLTAGKINTVLLSMSIFGVWCNLCKKIKKNVVAFG